MDLHDEVFAEPILTDRRLIRLHESLTSLLAASDARIRAQAFSLLERWKKRIRFVDALQKAKDDSDN